MAFDRRGRVFIAFRIEWILTHVEYIATSLRFFIPEMITIHLVQDVIENTLLVDEAQVVDAFLRENMGAMQNHLALFLVVIGQGIQARDGALDPGCVLSEG